MSNARLNMLTALLGRICYGTRRPVAILSILEQRSSGGGALIQPRL
jgi:hypothetical protein